MADAAGWRSVSPSETESRAEGGGQRGSEREPSPPPAQGRCFRQPGASPTVTHSKAAQATQPEPPRAKQALRER